MNNEKRFKTFSAEEREKAITASDYDFTVSTQDIIDLIDGKVLGYNGDTCSVFVRVEKKYQFGDKCAYCVNKDKRSICTECSAPVDRLHNCTDTPSKFKSVSVVMQKPKTPEKCRYCLTCRNKWDDECSECSALFDPACKITCPPSNYSADRLSSVEHPAHYTSGGIECIEAIEASMTADSFQDYCKGNIIKYIWRWRSKGGVEDLKKARVYLDWLIQSADTDESEGDDEWE